MNTENIYGFKLLKIIYKKRKPIIIIALVTFILSIVFSLIVPLYYRGVSTIMPPLEDGGFSNIASLMSDLPLKALGLGTSTAMGAETFMAILKSRTIMTAAADSFNLMQRYKKKNIELTLKELRDHIGVNLDDEGTITLFAEAGTCWFPSSQSKEEARILARDMANFFIDQLDIMNRRMRSERGRNTRIFIEKRYLQAINELQLAEKALKDFQETHGLIYLPEQTTATIETGAEIKAQVIAKEIEMTLLRQTVGTGHSEFKKANLEYDLLNRKYEQFKTSHGDKDGIFIPFENIPELGMRYLQLYREVKLQEKLLEFILPQLEQAKIEEMKNTPSLQILDKAVKPIRKHRPKRAMIVIFFTFLSILISSTYFYTKPFFHSLHKKLQVSSNDS